MKIGETPKDIEIIVSADGKSVQITALGFAGKGCAAATRPYEQALGGAVTDTPTADMHKLAPAVQQEVQRRL